MSLGLHAAYSAIVPWWIELHMALPHKLSSGQTGTNSAGWTGSPATLLCKSEPGAEIQSEMLFSCVSFEFSPVTPWVGGNELRADVSREPLQAHLVRKAFGNTHILLVQHSVLAWLFAGQLVPLNYRRCLRIIRLILGIGFSHRFSQYYHANAEDLASLAIN